MKTSSRAKRGARWILAAGCGFVVSYAVSAAVSAALSEKGVAKALPPRHRPAESSPPPEASEPSTGFSSAVENVEPAKLAMRAREEWPGMPINLALQALCDESARCGLAMACHHGQCGPCAADEDCAPGEGCSVQHCVPLSRIACRSVRDCAGARDGALCMLSGISDDPRGNASMRAVCSDELSALDREEERRRALEPRPNVESPPRAAARIEGSPQHLAELLGVRF